MGVKSWVYGRRERRRVSDGRGDGRWVSLKRGNKLRGSDGRGAWHGIPTGCFDGGSVYAGRRAPYERYDGPWVSGGRRLFDGPYGES